MTLLGRVVTTETRPAAFDVYVNDAPAGHLTLAPELGVTSVELPHTLLVSGTNHIELRREPRADGGVALSTAWFDGTSASTHVDVGVDGAQAELEGDWGPVEASEGRSFRALRQGSASVRFPSNPLPQAYGLALLARCVDCAGGAAPLGVALGGRDLGEVRVETEWTTLVLGIPVDRLVHGDGRLELTPKASAERAILVDRLAVVPLQDRAFINVGGARARTFLERGFSTDEAFGSGNAVWSLGKQSRLTFVLNPAKEVYVIALQARALAALAPLSVRLRLNGNAIGTVSLTANLAVHELSVEPWHFARGGNRLEFDYAATGVPRALDPGSTDSRDLAMQLDWLEVRRESQGPSRSKGSAG